MANIIRGRKVDSHAIAQETIREQEAMASTRSPWERSWQDITERILPNFADFQVKRMEGQQRTEKIYDGTGPLALERFGAAFESYLCPRTQIWHLGKPGVYQLRDDKECAVWADAINTRMWDMRNRPAAGFQTATNEIYTGLGALGTSCRFSEMDRGGGGPRYRSIPLAEIYISPNKDGRIDKLHRRFEYTARQAAERWGADRLPPKIKEWLDKDPEHKSEYIHCVKPRLDYQPHSRLAVEAPFLSTYVSIEDQLCIGQGGFFEFPYFVSRYTTSPRESYGRSPAFLVLSDLKMINEMSRDQIKILNRQADPPLLAFDDGVIEKFSMRPGALNMGGVNEQGQQLVHAMQFGSNPNALDKEMSNRRNMINTAFLVTLFQILVEHPRMSATEVLERAKEKGALLAPTAGRQITEDLDPMLRRDFRMMQRHGVFADLPPPRKLIEMHQGPDDIWIPEFDNQLTRAAKAEKAAGLLRTLEILAPAAQFDMSVLDFLDLDTAGPEIARINNCDPRWILSPDEIAAKRQGRAQAAQQQQLLAAVPAIAQGLERVSQAQLNMANAKA